MFSYDIFKLSNEIPHLFASTGIAVQVTLDCFDENGTPCNDLARPEGPCSVGKSMNTVRFQLEFCTCEESRNTQEMFDDNCQDLGPLPGPEESVRISCASPSGATLFSDTIQDRNDIIINDAGPLPEEITCTISSTTGQALQIFTINTSGQVDLYLKDKYASFELEACDALDCITNVTYTYNALNTGGVDMIVEEFQKNTIGVITDLLLDLDPVLVRPGETSSVTATEPVDTCVSGEFFTTVNVVATPPNGATCQGEADYFFEIEVGCRVDVEISCKDENGNDCTDLVPPQGSCTLTGAELTQLKFRYVTCACEDSLNAQPAATCTDFAPLPDGEVVIDCIPREGGSSLTITPNDVMPGDTLIIATPDGSPLPTEIVCTVADGDTIVQEFSFFSGDDSNQLNLKNKFGSFELEGCTNDDGGTQDCEALLCYFYEIENVGTDDMDLTLLERTRNNSTDSLYELLDVTFLRPGEETTVEEKELTDICLDETYTTAVVVEADPPNGITCQDEDVYMFDLNPPCVIFVDLDCTTEDGRECTELTGEDMVQCRCTDGCAREITYRYTASSCSPGSTECSDSGSNGATAFVTITEGSTNYFSREIEVGNDIVISNNGECIPDVLEATVSTGGSTTQTVTLDSRCSGGSATLLDTYGAFEFAGYTCSDDIPHNCYIDVEFNIFTQNIGVVSQTITSWSFEVSGEERGPATALPTLLTGEGFTQIEQFELELCADNNYVTNVEVAANGAADNELCRDQAPPYPIPITANTPFPSPSPSETPSAAPSATPTQSPSAAPSASPSTGPSAVPTESPSAMPSASPSAAPSAAPSPSPSFAPTPPPTGEPSASPSNPPSEYPTPEAPCVFDMDILCVPPPGVDSCNATPPPVEQCQGRPFEMVFLYNGGDCEQSYNIQPIGDKFFCTDFDGGPPTEKGAQSYIVVTDRDGETVYHDDWVAVGELFTLSDGGNNFVANQIITIYRNNNTNDPANIIQSMQYHSSCSNNLFLKDRFGAVQLVIWVNEEQGVVSCFANQTFELDITVPLDIQGGPAMVNSLTIASNVDPFFFNLTDKVAGIIVDAGDTIQTSVSIPIDLTSRRTYNLLITLTATTMEGKICRATELTSFTAGYPLPPIFPTFSPTQAPTGTPAPTRDPDTSPCTVNADINCESSSGRSCRLLSAPSSSICNSEEDITSVDFLMTGNACGTTEDCEGTGAISAADVYISVVDRDTIIFAGVIQQGQIFRVSGPFYSDLLEITMSSNGNGAPGTVLQTLDRVSIACDGDDNDLRLLQNYGALQVVGFNNPDQGSESIIETFTMTYIIRNEGSGTTSVETGVGSSPFEAGPIELVTSPTELVPGEELAAQTFAVVNLADSSGSVFRFDLSTTGRSVQSNRLCSDTTAYVIQVE